jgi:hypothetical protein
MVRANSRPSVRRTCPQCGKEYGVFPYMVRRGIGTYCGARCYHASHTRPLAERFWECVEKSEGCWHWVGHRLDSGYGMIKPLGQNPVGAHRISWELHNGPVPAGLDVLHHCDNPSCVRPDHLFLGTQADNMADMVIKKRSARGEQNAQSKLTAEQVASMRARHACGEASKRQLAREHGVSQRTAQNAIDGRTWKHV